MENNFDLVMDYIDANIHKDTEIINKGIYELIGCNSHTFGKCFKVLTGESLFRYISERKIYFAAQELRFEPEKAICDIALKYGYSEQSSFTRAMKAYYDCTPYEIRKGTVRIPEKKCRLKDFVQETPDTRTQSILEAFKRGAYISSSNIDLLMEIESASDEYGFDIDTCYQIADLAERLEVPVSALMKECFCLVSEIRSNPYYISPLEEILIDCCIDTEEELQMICDYFGCKYYDLDYIMVQMYRDRVK